LLLNAKHWKRPAVLSDIEIAQQARMQRIAVLARERLGIAEEP
jgi:hypothetical protein